MTVPMYDNEKHGIIGRGAISLIQCNVEQISKPVRLEPSDFPQVHQIQLNNHYYFTFQIALFAC